MEKIIFEGVLDKSSISYEDGGAAIIAEPEWTVQNGDENIFVRIQSWDESIWDNPMVDIYHNKQEKAQLGHPKMQELLGKKIRVTVEIVD